MTEVIERKNRSILVIKVSPPRIQVVGDEDERLDPKAVVIEMLKTSQKKIWSESLD